MSLDPTDRATIDATQLMALINALSARARARCFVMANGRRIEMPSLCRIGTPIQPDGADFGATACRRDRARGAIPACSGEPDVGTADAHR